MGFFSAIARAINKEYDRRIKRASLVTEYGAHQHHHDDEAHGEHAAEAEHAAEGAAEIANVPRGTPVKHS